MERKNCHDNQCIPPLPFPFTEIFLLLFLPTDGSVFSARGRWTGDGGAGGGRILKSTNREKYLLCFSPYLHEYYKSGVFREKGSKFE
jgi:hypothetical protein